MIVVDAINLPRPIHFIFAFEKFCALPLSVASISTATGDNDWKFLDSEVMGWGKLPRNFVTVVIIIILLPNILCTAFTPTPAIKRYEIAASYKLSPQLWSLR